MLFLLLSSLLAPADTVSGRVIDDAGQPVAQAIVEVVDLGRSVPTGMDGAFRIALAPGRYTLAVRRHGFASAVREISVGGGQPTASLEIVLTPSAFRLEPVTVTATRQPLAAEFSPLPTDALAGDELRRAQSVSLAHVVEALPGVRAITTGSQVGKPVIRGFYGPRVLVLENGSRLEDYSWSDEDGPSVETAFVRRIELIRGPASVLYGSDAVGGVINVIPEQLPDAGGGAAFTRTGFTLSGASNNTEVDAGARVEGASGNFGWRVNAIGHGSSNLHTPAGELRNTGFGAFNGEAAGGWRWPSGSDLAIRVVHYGGEFKLLEANAPPGEKGGPARKAGDERIQITGQRPWGAWRLEAKAQLQRHSLIEVADDSTGKESEQFNLLLQTGSLDLLLHHGGTTFGIRVELDGTSFAYLPDHALGSVSVDLRTSAESLAAGVDLLLHDGQFLASEREVAGAYGHSTIDDAMRFADRCGVGELVLTHHAPTRTDAQLDAVAATMTMTPQGRPVSFARQGDTLLVAPARLWTTADARPATSPHSSE